jgi:hypothetical protein
VYPVLRPKIAFLLLGLAPLLLAGVSHATPGQDEEATPIPLVGLNLPKTYARDLTLLLAIPSDYHEDGYRRWSGPGFYDPKKPSVRGVAGIQWLVRIDSDNGTAEAAVMDTLSTTSKYSKYVSRGPVNVPHLAADGRGLGVLAGFSVIVQSADPKANAQYQGALAFRLARPTPIKASARRSAPFVVVRFKLELPASDRYVVAGATPSAWNLERTRAALAGVRLVGGLPPGRMTVAVRDFTVRGAVVDLLGHRVPGAIVTMYRVIPPVRRSAKPTLSRVTEATTGSSGRYTLLIPYNIRPGVYRVVARLGQSAISRSLRLRYRPQP